jgi:hypothetical protein
MKDTNENIGQLIDEELKAGKMFENERSEETINMILKLG